MTVSLFFLLFFDMGFVGCIYECWLFSVVSTVSLADICRNMVGTEHPRLSPYFVQSLGSIIPEYTSYPVVKLLDVLPIICFG